jgi:hypothetical protein
VRVVVATTFLVLAATLNREAAAEDTKAQCAHSAESSQRLRDTGKPLAARSQLLLCARPACPAIVRSRCALWLEQIEAAIPTVVIKARAGSAERTVDVTDVRVSIDGVPTLDSLDGQPLRLEPGRHTLKYTRAGVAPIEAQIVLGTGEKNRLLSADFVNRDRPSPPPPTSVVAAPPAHEAEPPPSDSSPAPAKGGTTRPAAWAFAGLAVVAAGSFGYFGLTGKSDLDGLRATCAGHCDSSAVSAAWNKLIVADASAGIGLVSLGLATWLFLRPEHTVAAPHPESAPTGLLVSPDGRGVQLGWHGVF